MRILFCLLSVFLVLGCDQPGAKVAKSETAKKPSSGQAIIMPPDPTVRTEPQAKRKSRRRSEPKALPDWERNAEPMTKADSLAIRGTKDGRPSTTNGSQKSKPSETTGKFLYLFDGDTAQVRINGQNIRVRLNGIDAPESKQPFGTKAKQALAKFKGKPVRLVKTGEDTYGRTLGDLYSGDEKESINLQLVRDGFAWHYKRFNKDKALAAAETEARQQKRGLWSGSEKPVPPWTWRREHSDR